MAFDGKYGRITTEYGDIPDDEPVLIFRAQDVTTPRVAEYAARVAGEVGATQGHKRGLRDAAAYIRHWQRVHRDRVKVPDTAEEQGSL